MVDTYYAINVEKPSGMYEVRYAWSPFSVRSVAIMGSVIS